MPQNSKYDQEIRQSQTADNCGETIIYNTERFTILIICHKVIYNIERLKVISEVFPLTINPSIIVQPLGLCREHISLQ